MNLTTHSAAAKTPPPPPESDLPDRVTALAAKLADAARAEQTRREIAESAQLARMMNDIAGKAFTLAMADRVFRSRSPAQQARRLNDLLKDFGAPLYLPVLQRAMLVIGAAAAKLLPGPVMSAMQAQLRRNSARVILAGEPALLNDYLQKRRSAGTCVNLNHLGEAILGEEEALRRLDAVLNHLRNPLVDYVSVKISAIFSQISVLDFDRTLEIIKDRLRILYRAAMKAGKFVNLDMEEYRDLSLTLDAFCDVLDEPEFKQLSAGIVLQAYLPDAWPAQQALTDWARRRVNGGGAAIKVRIVKGANLAMEQVEAELHGWNSAPYSSKSQTDANYRRMVEFGCRRENAAVVRLGVASHNLFDIALALILRDDNGVADRVEMEMLEGMANHQARVVQKKAAGLLVYAPSVQQDDFISALSYLVRRLDENTSPENFLHDLFDLRPDSPAWERQRSRFVAGWVDRETVSAESNRATVKRWPAGIFHNAADSDWTQPDERRRLSDALATWSAPDVASADTLPSVDAILKIATDSQPAWELSGTRNRAAALRSAAEVMESRRFATVAQMVHEAKKAAAEADVEISEAVDFAAYAADLVETMPNGNAIGIVVVTPPWNFPYAIPCGNVVHALAAGNCVILKPAPETVGVAWHLANHLWDAGVPRDVLQFYPCPDNEVGQALICDPRVTAVVLTGAYETARMFQRWRPSLKLFAETSGKNAIVVTAQADRDLAIKDIVRSAFGHSGQKCSAASLAILEAEVYDDPAFRRSLRDAAASLRVGPSIDLGSVVTPLIREPAQNLKRALTTLEPGEAWLLEPKVDPHDPCLWSPGIKLGVKAGSWFQQTECFGPVLGLIRASDLADAIRIQNSTPFGLTGGIHSLDEAEVDQWKHTVEVGNAYVNRSITGAVVRRQPFGGWKRSCIGPGWKMGGPNYLSLFRSAHDEEPAEDNFTQAWNQLFSKPHDPAQLRCESNELLYRPVRGVILRLERDDRRTRRLAEKAAAICGTRLHISVADQEPDARFIERLSVLAKTSEVLRTIAPPPDTVLRAAYDAGLNWIDASVTTNGKWELPRWLREQSIATTRHRYGLISEQT